MSNGTHQRMTQKFWTNTHAIPHVNVTHTRMLITHSTDAIPSPYEEPQTPLEVTPNNS